MIKVEVITPEKLSFSDSVEFIAAPAIDGEIGILPGHTPLLTQLGVGELRLKKGNDVQYLAIAGGFLEVQENNQVAIFAESAEIADEIDLERAKLAAEKAKAKIGESKDLTKEELASLEAALGRAIMRVKIGTVRKARKQPPGIH